MKTRKRTAKPIAKRQTLLRNRRLALVRQANINEAWQGFGTEIDLLSATISPLIESSYDDRQVAIQVLNLLHQELHVVMRAFQYATNADFEEGIAIAASLILSCGDCWQRLLTRHHIGPEEMAPCKDHPI